MATTRRRQPMPRPMLTEGNAHLGRLIWSFSIPAFSTCPGSTLACLSACDALNFLFSIRSTLDLHKANWERAEKPDEFARAMIHEIKGKYVRVLRIHVAGDFFVKLYVRAWIKVARSCPGVTFLFSTRSWRVPELVPDPVDLATLPNVYAWWSEDRDTGTCHLPVGRRCFLCIEPGDEALVPAGVDLVFRADTRRPLKWLGPTWVCPKEQGIANGLTCSSCRRCFLPGPMPRRDQA
jgi:hypothetical protein